MQPKYDALYRALVTSITDATGAGKIRVQCPQVGGLAEIRAAEPANPGMPLPTVGSTVWIMFSGGDITKPAYFANSVWNSSFLVQDWTNFSLVSGFTANGNNNGTPQFQIVSDYGSLRVNLQGGINITYPSSTIANGGTWTTIPSLARPTTALLRTCTGACSAASSTAYSLKMDFSSGGGASIVGTNTTTIQPPWVSLNGLHYYI